MTLFLNTLFWVDNIIQILILILCFLFSHSIYDLLFWFLFQTSFWVDLNKKLLATVEIRGYFSNANLKTESNRLLELRCKLEKIVLKKPHTMIPSSTVFTHTIAYRQMFRDHNESKWIANTPCFGKAFTYTQHS